MDREVAQHGAAMKTSAPTGTRTVEEMNRVDKLRSEELSTNARN